MQHINEIKTFILSQFSATPDVAIILGSGLADFSKTITSPVIISYRSIPHFPATTVAGHPGELVLGKIGDKVVMAFVGRFHLYEGRNFDEVGLPVTISHAMGVKKIIFTNAAGGINLDFAPGDLVAITDHINFMGKNPLIGENDDQLGPRFPDMSDIYSKKLIEELMDINQQHHLNIKTGVYAGVLGPSYETPAEIRMLRTLGADMVGMSTVPEVILARYFGLEILAISCITNMGAGIRPEKIRHADVKIEASKAMERFCLALIEVIKRTEA